MQNQNLTQTPAEILTNLSDTFNARLRSWASEDSKVCSLSVPLSENEYLLLKETGKRIKASGSILLKNGESLDFKERYFELLTKGQHLVTKYSPEGYEVTENKLRLIVVSSNVASVNINITIE